MESFNNLKVWDKAHALALDVYRSSKSFPRYEIYGSTSQMRRASVALGANIAECVSTGRFRLSSLSPDRGRIGERIGVSPSPRSRSSAESRLRRRGRGGKTGCWQHC